MSEQTKQYETYLHERIVTAELTLRVIANNPWDTERLQRLARESLKRSEELRENYAKTLRGLRR